LGDTGPEHWGDLDSSFHLCAHGVQQTPIDLPAKAAATSHAPPRPQWSPVPLTVVNNGHTIQVVDTAPSSFTVDGTTYALAQFHFHSPAEHTIGGRTYDAELHLVHKSSDGKVLVVGILFKEGAENALLEPIWDAMPPEESPVPKTVSNVAIDLASLLPSAPRYLRYDGSLTVPPCTEGVRWLVVEPDPSAPPQLSRAQIAKLRAATHGETNRPIQPLGGRSVTELLP
jgi:carbonic anhydrase